MSNFTTIRFTTPTAATIEVPVFTRVSLTMPADSATQFINSFGDQCPADLKVEGTRKPRGVPKPPRAPHSHSRKATSGHYQLLALLNKKLGRDFALSDARPFMLDLGYSLGSVAPILITLKHRGMLEQTVTGWKKTAYRITDIGMTAPHKPLIRRPEDKHVEIPVIL